jgi:hypothetical protein
MCKFFALVGILKSYSTVFRADVMEDIPLILARMKKINTVKVIHTEVNFSKKYFLVYINY